MTIALFLFALIPVGYGLIIGGDFTQMLYKPTYGQINFVLTRRRQLIAASLLLWLAGLASHIFAAPTAIWLIVSTAVLLPTAAIGGFYMSPYLLFRAVRNGRWRTVSAGNIFLQPDDTVIGVVVNGDARAFPLNSVLRPHMIKEQIGGKAITLSYCMLSNSAMAFGTQVDGQTVDFLTPLQWENNMMMYDASSGALLQQITGRSVNSNALELTTYPTQIMSWQAWRSLHPDTHVLYNPVRGLFDRVVRFLLRTKIYEPNRDEEALIFPTITAFDERLPRKEQVLGVCVADSCQAYPVRSLKENPVQNETIRATPLVVAYDEQRDFSDIFRREVAGRTLTFSRAIDGNGHTILIDQETGTEWALNGKAQKGPLQGQQLEAYAHFNRVFWFIWKNFFPQTKLRSAR